MGHLGHWWHSATFLINVRGHRCWRRRCRGGSRWSFLNFTDSIRFHIENDKTMKFHRICSRFKGLTEMTIKYDGDRPASRIELYFAGVHDDYPVLCTFSNISPGDTIECSSTPYDTFRDSTIIGIQYDRDCDPQSPSSDSSDSDRRRLIRTRVRDDRNRSSSDDSYRKRDSVDPSDDTDESQYSTDYPMDRNFAGDGDDDHDDNTDSDDGDSEDSEDSEDADNSDQSEDSTDSSAGGQCIAKFRTYCSRSIVGSRSEGCDDLRMVSYVDGAGHECDQITLHGSSQGDTNSDSDDHTYNAIASGQGMSASTSPIEWIKGLDPFTRYTLLAIMVTSVALMCVACYICVYVNVQKGSGRKDEQIAGRAPSVEIEPGAARRDSVGQESVRGDRSRRDGSDRRSKERISSRIRRRKRERVRTISYDNIPLEMDDDEFEDRHIAHHAFVRQRDGVYGQMLMSIPSVHLKPLLQIEQKRTCSSSHR